MEASHGISSSNAPRPAGAQSGQSVPSVEREAGQKGPLAPAPDRFDRPTSEFLRGAVGRLRSAASDRLESVRSRMRDGSLASLDDPAKTAAAAHSIVDGCVRE
jgi:hypothetical protein